MLAKSNKPSMMIAYHGPCRRSRPTSINTNDVTHRNVLDDADAFEQSHSANNWSDDDDELIRRRPRPHIVTRPLTSTTIDDGNWDSIVDNDRKQMTNECPRIGDCPDDDAWLCDNLGQSHKNRCIFEVHACLNKAKDGVERWPVCTSILYYIHMTS